MNRVERASRLAHDVGKYIARIARNVAPEGPVPAALVPLLVRDLYDRPGEPFEVLAEGLDHAGVHTSRTHLERIAELETAVREGEPEACAEACRLALEVESELNRVVDAARDAGAG